jgi:hypothetical protein
MALPAFTLRLPADAPFRSLAGAVAGRLLEGRGVDAATCGTFAESLSRTVGDLAGEAGAVDLEFVPGPDALEVIVKAGGRRRTVTQSHS